MSGSEPSVPKRTEPPWAKPREEKREKTPIGRVIKTLGKRRVILFGVLLGFTIVLAWVFLSPVPPKVNTDPAGVSCVVKYPKWIAVGDVEEFTITLINNSNKVLTEVNAFLVFTDTLHVSTDVNSSTKADFGELAVNEQKTRSIRFLLDRAEAKSPLGAELRIAANELGKETLDTYTFRVIHDLLPIPYCKSILRKLVAFVILALSPIGDFIRDFIRKEISKTLQLEERVDLSWS